MNWIDSFLATPAQRRSLLKALLLVYWLWQLVWLLLAMAALAQIQSYDALFVFAASLKRYQVCLPIRLALWFLSQTGFSLSSFSLLIQSVSLLDWLAIFFTIVLLASSRQKLYVLALGGLLAAFAIFSVGILALGLQAATLMEAIQLMRLLGIVLFLAGALYTVLLLSALFETVFALLWERKLYLEHAQNIQQEI